MKSFRVMISISVFCFLLSEVSLAQTGREFRIFDAIMIKDKPSLYKYGFSKINMIYEDSILINNPKSTNTNNKLISERKYSKLKSRVRDNSPICIDIEGWTLYSGDIKSNVPKFVNLTRRMKKDYPNNKIGYYGVLPFADMQLYNQFATYKDKNGKSWLNKENRNWFKEWNSSNNGLYSIAQESDIAFPSCYTRFKDKNLWLQVTNAQIKKIRELNPKIKIYAFVWPQYYAKGTSAFGDEIETDFWSFQLNYLYKVCDGIVLWMPPFHLKDRKTIFWDSESKWFQATLSFIKEKKITNK